MHYILNEHEQWVKVDPKDIQNGQKYKYELPTGGFHISYWSKEDEQ